MQMSMKWNGNTKCSIAIKRKTVNNTKELITVTYYSIGRPQKHYAK